MIAVTSGVLEVLFAISDFFSVGGGTMECDSMYSFSRYKVSWCSSVSLRFQRIF